MSIRLEAHHLGSLPNAPSRDLGPLEALGVPRLEGLRLELHQLAGEDLEEIRLEQKTVSRSSQLVMSSATGLAKKTSKITA